MDPELIDSDIVAEEADAPEPVEGQEQETPAEALAPEEGELAKPEKKDRLQLRFSDLTRQRDEAAAEREYWRNEAMRNQPAHAPRQEDGPPDPSQFDGGEYDPAYIDARIDYGVKTGVSRAIEEARAKETQQSAARAHEARVTSLRDRLFESGLEGAITIASGGNVPFSPAMIDTLSVSENAPVVADFLGKNPAEAGRIAGLPPSVQGFELAKLEARLAGQPKPTTNAKPAIPTLTGSRGQPVSGLRDDMPIDQWMRLHGEGRR